MPLFSFRPSFLAFFTFLPFPYLLPSLLPSSSATPFHFCVQKNGSQNSDFWGDGPKRGPWMAQKAGFGIGSAKILIETYSSKKILSEHPNCTLLISKNPYYDPN